MVIPRLYGIVDMETLERWGLDLREFVAGLAEGGVTLVQLRDKVGTPQQVLERGAVLRECLPGATLIMNDRVDLGVLAGFDGVHLGQEDLSAEDARRVVRAHSSRWGRDEWGTRPVGSENWDGRLVVGVSTHGAAEMTAAEAGAADYVAVGPVFGTQTKLDASPVVGLEGVCLARSLTRKPLVAIGGITRDNAARVIQAGADAVAVISGLLPGPGETVAGVCRDWLRVLAG